MTNFKLKYFALTALITILSSCSSNDIIDETTNKELITNKNNLDSSQSYFIDGVLTLDGKLIAAALKESKFTLYNDDEKKIFIYVKMSITDAENDAYKNVNFDNSIQPEDSFVDKPLEFNKKGKVKSNYRIPTSQFQEIIADGYGMSKNVYLYNRTVDFTHFINFVNNQDILTLKNKMAFTDGVYIGGGTFEPGLTLRRFFDIRYRDNEKLFAVNDKEVKVLITFYEGTAYNGRRVAFYLLPNTLKQVSIGLFKDFQDNKCKSWTVVQVQN